MIFRVRRSARAFCREMTAHTAAGIQPKTVICRTRQSSPLNNLPRNKKESQGSKIAMSVMPPVEVRIYRLPGRCACPISGNNVLFATLFPSVINIKTAVFITTFNITGHLKGGDVNSVHNALPINIVIQLMVKKIDPMSVA